MSNALSSFVQFGGNSIEKLSTLEIYATHHSGLIFLNCPKILPLRPSRTLKKETLQLSQQHLLHKTPLWHSVPSITNFGLLFYYNYYYS